MARIQAADGVELNCEVADYLWPWQHPTPVLLQHGFSRNASFWRKWVPQIAEGRRVYRPDMRGCGLSGVPPSPVEVGTETLTGDILRIFDALGIERVHWVGEASGGVLGILFASQYPERVASIVLLNSPVRVRAITTTYAFDTESTSAAIRKYGVGGWCRKSLGYRLDLDRAVPEMQEFFVNEMDKTPVDAAAAIHDYIEELDTMPLLGALKVPVLLLSGDKKKTTVEQQQIMQREILQVQFRSIEGYGPGISVIAPERCAAEARTFWDAIDQPASGR